LLIQEKKSIKGLDKLAPYFACLPFPALAIQRVIDYTENNHLNDKDLSNAIRHHLYDNVLYATTEPIKQERILYQERYPAKI